MFINSKPSRTWRTLALWVLLSHTGSLIAPALANPANGSVTAGGASILDAGALTTIRQTTDRAVIDWRSFSNAAGETVRFEQPGSTSITLNRVTGADSSLIQGALEANGRVFLLNPNGVVFGSSAQVRVNGLLASTLSMSDEDFLAGRFELTQDGTRPLGGVINRGRIEADGGVALVAPIVNNEGQIVASLGQVSLAGTTRAVVNFDQQGLVSVTVPAGPGARGDVELAPGASSEFLERVATSPGIVEAGEIVRTADGRTLLKGAEGLAVNEGTIRAHDAVTGAGGTVRVLGTRGAVLSGSSVIDASGSGTGAGGDVRVLSPHAGVMMPGSRVAARGGDQGGDGGFVELSSARVRADGAVDTRGGAAARTGSFLIDPDNIHIVDGAAGTGDDAQIVPDGAVLACEGTGSDFTISDGQINATGATTDISLAATDTIDFDGAVDINIANDITFSSATFTMTGTDRITANRITVATTGDATLGLLTATGAVLCASPLCVNAGGGINVSGTTMATAGTVNLTAGTTISVDQPITGQSVFLTATAGAVVLNNTTTATTGSLVFRSASTLCVSQALSAPVDVVLTSTAGNVVTNATVAADNDANGTGTAALSAAADVVIDNTVNGAVVTARAGGQITVLDPVTATAAGAPCAGNLTLEAAANVLVDANLAATNELTVIAAGSLIANAASMAADSDASGAGLLSLTATGGVLDLRGAATGACVSAVGQTIVLGGAASIAGRGEVVLETTAGAMQLDGSVTSTNGQVTGRSAAGFVANNTITGSSDVTLDAATALTLASTVSSSGGDVFLGAAGGALTVSGPVVASGSVRGNATNNVLVCGAITAQNGSLDLSAGGLLTVTAPLQSRSDMTLVAASDLTALSSLTATSGRLTLTSTSGDLSLVGAVNADSVVGQAGGALTAGSTVTADAGELSLIAGGTLSANASLTSVTDLTLTGTDMTLVGAVRSSNGTLIANSTGSLQFSCAAEGNAVNAQVSGSLTALSSVLADSGNVSLVAGSNLQLCGTVSAPVGSATLTASGGSLSAAGAITARALTGRAGTAMTLSTVTATAGAVNLFSSGLLTAGGAITAPGDISLRAGSALGNTQVLNSACGTVNLTSVGGSATVQGDLIGNSVLVNVGGNILLSRTVFADTGTVDLNAGGNIMVDPGAPITAAGSASLRSGVALSLRDTLTAQNGTATVSSGSGMILLGAVNGDRVVGSSGGSMCVNRPVTADAGSVSLTSGGALLVSAGAPVSATAGIELAAAGTLVLDDSVTGSGGAVTLSAGSDLSILDPVSGDSVSGSAGGVLVASSPVTADVGAVSLAAGADLTVSAAVSAATDVSLVSTGGTLGLTVSPTAGTGSLFLQSAAALLVSVPLAAPTDVSVTSTGACVAVASPITATNGRVTVSAAAAATVNQALNGNAVTGVAGTTLAVNSTITADTTTLDLTAGTVLSLNAAATAATAATLSAGTDLNVSAPLTSNAGTVGLSAGSALTIGAAVTGDAVNATANGALVVNAPVTADVSAVNLTSGASLSVSAGAPILGATGATLDAGTNLTLDDSVTGTAGAVSLSACGAMTLNAAVNGDSVVGTATSTLLAASTITADTGAVSLTAGTNLTTMSTVAGATDVSLVANGALDVQASPTAGTGSVLLAAGAAFDLVVAVAAPVNVSVSSAADLTLSAPVTATNGAVTLVASAGALTVNQDVNGNSVSGAAGTTLVLNDTVTADTTTVNMTAGTDLTVNAGGTTLGQTDVNLVGGSNVAVSGFVTSTNGTATLNAGTGAVVVNADVNANAITSVAGTNVVVNDTLTADTSVVNLTAGADLTVNAGGTILGATDLNLVAGNNLTLGDAATATNGTVTLTAAVGALAIGADVNGNAVTGVAGTTLTVNDTVTADTTFANLTAGTDLTVNAGGTILGATDVNLTALTGQLLLDAPVTATAGGVVGSAATNVNVNQALVGATNVSLIATTGTLTTAAAVTASAGSVSLTSGGALTAGATVSGTANVSLLSTAGNVVVNSTVASDSDASGAGALSLLAPAGAICVTAPLTGASVEASAFGNIGLAASVTTPGTLLLATRGTATQTAGVLTAGNLVLSTAAGAEGSGDFALAGVSNAAARVGTARQVNSVSFRNDAGFDVTGIDADTAVTLQSTGTITGSGGITTTTLTLVGAATSSFVLDTADNEGTLVVTSGINAFEYRDDDGFTISGMTASRIELVSNGVVTQTGALVTPLLVLGGATAGQGSFVLDTIANTVTTLSTGNAAGSIAFRDVDGLSITAASVSGAFSLVAAGAVTDVGSSGLTAGSARFNIGAGNDLGSASNRFDASLGSLTVDNAGAAGANNVFLRETDALVADTVRFAGTFDLSAGGTFTDNGTNGLFGPTVRLDVGTANDVGSAANFLNTAIDTLNVGASPGARNVFVTELDALTVGLVETDPSGSAQLTVGGALSLGRIVTGTFGIITAGSIFDANPVAGDNTPGVSSAAANITSTGSGRIATTLGGTTVGSFQDSVDVLIGGVLTLDLAGDQSGISGVFFGQARDVVVTAATGQVFFNANDLTGANQILKAAGNSAVQAATATVFQGQTTAPELVELSSDFDDDGAAVPTGSTSRSGKGKSTLQEEDEEKKKKKLKKSQTAAVR